MSLRANMLAVFTAIVLLSFCTSARGAEARQADGPAAAPPRKLTEAGSHFTKAVLLFKQRKYDDAAAEVEAAMRLNPSSAELVELRDQIGEATMVQMLNNPKLRDKVRAILQIAEQETLRKRTDPAEIQKLIKDLDSEDFAVYWKAITEFIVIGDYAVPYLLETLVAPEPTRAGTLAIVALTRMGKKAVLPLIEALKSDNVNVVGHAADILGNIGDIRALAALKSLSEEPDLNSVLRGRAAQAAAKIAGKDSKQLAPAAQQYLELAEMYYRGDYKVVGYLVDPVMFVWRWEEGPAAKTIPEKLRHYAAPRYMFNLIMAANACYAGLDANPADSNLVALLAAVYYNGAGQVTGALRGHRMSTLGLKFTDEELKTLQAMQAVAITWSRLAEITGSKYVNAALERALAEQNGPMALAAIRGLRDLGDDSPKAGVSGIIAAMASPDKFVRYAAAEALVTIAPRGNLGGETLAMRVTAAALTENARRTVLLIQRNTQTANALKAALRPGDLKITAIADLNAAREHLRKTFLPVDVVVVEDGIGNQDTVSFARRLKLGAGTPNVGVIVTTAKDAEEAQKAYAEYADCVLAEASAAQELLGKVQTVLAKPGLKMDEKAVTLAVKRTAVQAVAALDPAVSAYPMKDLVPALIPLLDEADESLRTLAVVALGNIGDRTGIGKILAVIADPKQPDKLRGAALLAVGSIWERTRHVIEDEHNVVAAALRDPKVRAQAGIALGRAGLGPKAISNTLSGVRPPMRLEALGAAGPAKSE